MSDQSLAVEDVMRCFTGVIPLVLTTASVEGEPNVTYVSRAHPVDPERIAISNQFLSKTRRNLAMNPRATLLLTDPMTLGEYRAWITFEQTLRRGPVFDRLQRDLSMIAALTGMRDVFRLSGADVFRVTNIQPVVVSRALLTGPPPVERMFANDHAALGDLCGQLSRCSDLDSLVDVLVTGLHSLLGYDHSMLLLADEPGELLFTIASHGYGEQGVGSEVRIGEGLIGHAAEVCAPVRADPLFQMTKYASTLRASVADEPSSSNQIAMPGLARPASQLAVPAVTLGMLIGVLVVESEQHDRYTTADEAVLSILASLVAGMIEAIRRETAAAPAVATVPGSHAPQDPTSLIVRYYPSDGSTFFNSEYIIKGVAGRLLWTILRQCTHDGRREFTNRELRLDASLELPDFRDNFESRLILLKRRLEDRSAPIRLHKTGRGRFRVDIDNPIVLEQLTRS